MVGAADLQQSQRGRPALAVSDGKHIAIGGSTFHTNVWMVETSEAAAICGSASRLLQKPDAWEERQNSV